MRAKRIILALLLCAMTAVFVLAQSNTGSLTGRVLDPNGGVIPGAKVVLKHAGTGVETTGTSNEMGAYTFPSLPVGPYTVTVEQAGFKKLTRTGLVIAVATRSVLDLPLQVGDIQQSVDVTAEAPLLAAANSELGTNFQPRLMADAPLFVSGGFRNPEKFISYMPGVNGGDQETSVNGGSRRSKEILIDGASHTNPESGGVSFQGNGGLGAVEMFGEFRLVTGAYSAEYGRSGGGVEIFVTKSGTNRIHGTAFDFLRNDKLDAAGWAVNQRRPFLGKSKVRQNEFGASVGGPVWIPGVYNGKNRTFFYFTYNGYRQNNGGGTGVATVPTALMKQGNFSELGSKLIYDPETSVSTSNGIVRTPFPNNTIPTNRFSSVSGKILSLIPNPTGSGISSNYNTTSLSTVNKNIYSIKLDHTFTDRNRVSGFFSWQSLDLTSRGGLPGGLASGNNTADTPDTTRVNHDFLFRPNLLNHFTFGLSRYHNEWTQLAEHRQDWPTKLGLTGVATGDSSSFPVVTFGDGLTGFGNNSKTRGSQENYVYTIADTLSWVRGRHELKFGMDYHRGRTFQVPMDEAGSQGIFAFNNYATSGGTALKANTGYSFASFLLGETNSAQRYYYTKGVDLLYTSTSSFVQDNIKVTPKLTLQLGARWEIYVPRTDRNETQSSFDPTVANPGANGRLGALTFIGTSANHNGKKRLGDVYWNNIGPRIGFAYNLTNKTVLRGGYGMYFSPANGNTGGGCFPCGWGTSASPTVTSLDGVSPALNWDGGFQPPAGFALPPVYDPSYANYQTVLVLSKEDGLAGRIQDWSLNVQHELKGFLVDVAYVGSKGARLNNYVSMNQVDPKYLSLGALLGKKITDPAVVAAGYTKPYASFPDTQSLAQALRPYPQFNSIIHTYLGKGETTYHSLQAKVERRFGALVLMGAYTWSKNMSINGAYTNSGNGIAPQDAYNTKVEKSLSIQDVPHVLNLVYSYELPIGKGRRYLAGTNKVLQPVISGWSISGIQVYNSGGLLRLQPTNTLGTGVLFTSALRASTTGSAIRTGVDRTSLDPNNPNVRWINRDAFALPGSYQFGNAAAFINELRNPMGRSENISFIKRTQIRESVNVEFRADMQNIFNRTTFSGVNINLTDPNFGRVTGVGTAPRTVQMALKLNF